MVFYWFRFFVGLLFSVISVVALAQPKNDECHSAISISQQFSGYNLGTFRSSKVDLSKATANLSEHFSKSHADIGLNQKSVWFYLDLPVRRKVSIYLKQKDTAIAQNAVGFAVYSTTNCYPNPRQLAGSFPIITKFGSATNACLKPGKYLIQVSANQKAKDSIWLESTFDYPATNNAHDAYKDAYVFNKPTENIQTTQELGCLSLDVGEEKGLPDSMNQSFWLTFKTASYFNEFMLSFHKSNVDSFKVQYSIYKGDVRNGLNTLDTLETHQPIYHSHLCILKRCEKLATNTWYSVQVVFHSKTVGAYQLSTAINSQTSNTSSNPKNIDKKNIITIDKSKDYQVSDLITCQSLIANNKCKPTDPDYYTHKYGLFNGTTFDTIIDTFIYQFLAVIDLKKQAYINIQGINNYRSLILFDKGDIRNNCAGLSKFKGACFQPGTYSIRVAIKAQTLPNVYLSPDRMLGNEATLNLQVTLVPRQGPAQYSTPAKTNIIDMSTGNAIYWSGYDSLLSPYRSYTIMGKTYTGRFNFHSFKIPKNAYYSVGIQESRYCKTSTFLFKGNSANGLATLDSIPGHGLVHLSYGLQLENQTTQHPFYCPKLEKDEWYTAMVLYPTDTTCFPNTCGTDVVIWEKTFNDTTGNFPGKAIEINNGLPISYSSNNMGSPSASNYMRTFTKKRFDFSCNRKYSNLFINCLQNLPAEPIYYVFELEKEATVHITTNNYDISIYLYPFDARTKDSLKLTNPIEVLESCWQDALYCKLQPGKYTVVALQYHPKTSANYSGTKQLEISVDQVKDAENKFAQNAYDFGLIPKEGSKISDGEYAGCLTSSFTRDKTKDTNLLYPTYSGVLYYSFLTAGVGDITVSINELTKKWGMAKSSFAVFQSPKSGARSFNELKALNKVDSVESAHFQKIAERFDNQAQTVTFEKATCDTLRYYIFLWPEKIADPFNYLFQVKVDYNNVKTDIDAGDFCENTINLNITKLGSFSKTLKPNCHTLGEGFGEDGSNMSCLGDTAGQKTSWFKINANTKDTFDLTVHIINNTNMASDKIRYRLFYGNCQSLTPATCVANANASFKFDCMPNGQYFVQISSPSLTTGEISLKTTLTKTDYVKCNPIDPQGVLANFKALGGCQHDYLTVSNLSTQGAQISYKWYFDGHFASNQKITKWAIKALNRIDTHMISLAVFNKTLKKYDSTWQTVFITKDSFHVFTSQDTNMLCRDSVQLSLKCSHPEALFLWQPSQFFSNPYLAKPILKRTWQQRQFWVDAEMGNCFASDSIRVWPYTNSQIVSSGKTCDTTWLEGPYGADHYWWNTGERTQKIVADTPGVYTLAVQDGDCHDTTSRTVYNTKTPDINIKANGACLGDELSIQLPEGFSNWQYLWNDGSTKASKTITDTGWVWLTASSQYEVCQQTDSHYINPKWLIKKPLTDTLICNDEKLLLDAKNPGKKYKWQDGSVKRTFETEKAGIFFVTISSDKCSLADTAAVSVGPPLPNIPDSMRFCEASSLEVTGVQSAISHLWSNASTDTFATFSEEGKYWLKLQQGRCTSIDSFYLLNKSGIVDLLGPDTNVCQPFSMWLHTLQGSNYVWNGPEGQATDSTYLAHRPGTYRLQMLVDGCLANDSIVIVDSCFYGLYVPNAFTPGNDAVNETFLPKGENIQTFSIKIFNRWGEKVYESTDLTTGWAGTFKGADCPMGIYVYVIEYKTATDRIHYLKGNLTLLR